jgi:hypothetical protein
MRTLYLRSYFSSAQFCVLADAYIRRFEQKKGQGAMVMASMFQNVSNDGHSWTKGGLYKCEAFRHQLNLTQRLTYPQ